MRSYQFVIKKLHFNIINTVKKNFNYPSKKNFKLNYAQFSNFVEIQVIVYLSTFIRIIFLNEKNINILRNVVNEKNVMSDQVQSYNE